MYASKLCKQIYAFEPDKTAYKYFLQNLDLNNITNVTPFNLAIAPKEGIIKMASHGGNQGDIMSSMVNIDNFQDSFKLEATTWDSWLKQNNHEKIDFIKIDIKGGEIDVIPNMLDFLKAEKPHLHLSIHGPYIKSFERIRKILEMLSFYPYCIDEQLNPIKPEEYIIPEISTKFRSLFFTSGK